MKNGIDLHSHLEGSIPIETLNLIRRQHSEKEIVIPNIKGLEQFSKLFGFFSRSLKTEQDYELATESFLLESYNNGVIYSEFRVSPYHHVILGGKSFEKIIEYVKKGIDNAYKKCGVVGKVIIESARQYGIEHVGTVLNRTLDCFDSEYIVGFGIGGIERPGDLYQYINLFRKCGNYNIPISVHAGETGDVDNVIMCLENPFVKRIGHGLSIGKVLNNYENKINYFSKLIEICISSNILLGHINSLNEHPVIQLYKAGQPISICTDDSSIFGITYQSELDLFKKLLKVSDNEIHTMNIESLKYLFCDESTKKRLLNVLQDN